MPRKTKSQEAEFEQQLDLTQETYQPSSPLSEEELREEVNAIQQRDNNNYDDENNIGKD